MTRERIAFDRQPPARTVECIACGLNVEIRAAGEWPIITVLPATSHEPMYSRTAEYDALGWCGCQQNYAAEFPAAQPQLLF